MLRVNRFLPQPRRLLHCATLTRPRGAGENSRFAVGLRFTRRSLIARFHSALRRDACRFRRSRHGQRRLILGDREVALAFYIVHSSEINMRPGNVGGIRRRGAFRGRTLGRRNHLGKQFARAVRFAGERRGHRQPIGRAQIIGMSGKDAFKRGRGRRAITGGNLALPFGQVFVPRDR